ncbi:glutaredoxin [Ricinus communis]|uniref:Glutaredoxin n=1 Tax=Ricinus communis TaxID=3988 RepID=B9RB02_RICCO|nr:glutaredoxin [Ricinus communis]XP_025014345.1 glutaredoxin [Ricinus communis]EEF51979.1 glutaredoxin-1, grx1, putative [Ricinus communis]|eukprot:XP_002511377.1 glutaredoxin [Ricinus communis]
MGSLFSSTKKTKEEIEMALNKAKDLSNSAPVVVFSKTYCGYCNRVKQLLTQLGANFKIIELNEEADGDDIQAALAQWTGLRTVPNVFIGGKHIGGCDSTLDKYQKGELLPLLNDAGAIANNSAQL